MQLFALRRLARRAARGLGLGLKLGLGLWACGGALGCGREPGPLRRFLEDPSHRRELLAEALWHRGNDYARLRLARYASGGRHGWLELPRFEPEVAPIPADGSTPPEPRFRALDRALPPASADDLDEQALRGALLRIGQDAFFTYPAQLVSGFRAASSSPALARSYGLWIGTTPRGEAQLGGLLAVHLPDGGRALATSCSTCHAAPDPDEPAAGRVLAGAANTELDVGKLVVDAATVPDPTVLPEAKWGPGRLDTSHDGSDNPAAIGDLRAVARQRYLHHDATLRSGPLALALRIETLITTSLNEGAAPPVEVALGLALYLWELAPQDPPPPSPEPGAALFQAHCARCHAPPDYAGEPVPLDEIGTDGALGRSRERGTGAYRTPTLRGMSRRRQLLHDGSLPDVRALLDPQRLEDSYRGGRHGAGKVPGHRYGLDLPAADRAALAGFLDTL